jgi:D-alanine-D-alanine ligase
MKVGMTYNLRDDYLALGYSAEETAEFDKVSTIEAIEGALRMLGYETDRIGHVWNLVKRLAAGDSWDMVFNIAEGLSGFGREAQIPTLLEAYGVPYTFSDPLVSSLTLHKGMTKAVLRDSGVPTPDFFVVETESDLADVETGLSFPLFAKPVAEGTGKGISLASKINSSAELSAVCRELTIRFQQPVLVEAYLPGREFTVGIVGTGSQSRVVGVMEIVLGAEAEAEAYTYFNKENYQDLVTYKLVDDGQARSAARVALRAYRILGCRDAARVDLRADCFGVPNFMEINPLAGLHPVHSDLPILWRKTGKAYSELIAEIMASAVQRTAGSLKPLYVPKNGPAPSCQGVSTPRLHS